MHLFCFVFFSQYSTVVTKFDRHGYKARKRLMILTDKHLYLVTDKDCGLKDKIQFDKITGNLLGCDNSTVG